MSVKDSNDDGSKIVECERCGYVCDPRGLSTHKDSARCDYLHDKRIREEEGFTKSMDHANESIRDWINRNTEDGMKNLVSRFSLGGPTWNPTTGYRHYTTPKAWETFLRENRLTNPEKQADKKVKIDAINSTRVSVQVEVNGGYDIGYESFNNELGIENKRKAWIRDDVLYTVDGDRIGVRR